MRRKIYIRNNLGQRWDLNSSKTGFYSSPAGLGFSKSANYIAIGSRFISAELKDQQATISGVIVFGRDGDKDPYQVQHDFTQFTELSESLEFVYETAVGTYYRSIDFVSFGKTELQNRLLHCDVQFICKSLFYDSQVDRFIVTRADGELRYSFRYPARFNDYANRTVDINNQGHTKAPFTAEIFGYTEYPYIVCKQNGAEVARVEFDTILQQNEKMLFSTVDGNLYCFKQAADGTLTNFTPNLDINNENFFKLPQGECQLVIASDTAVTNRTIFTIYKYYRTV